MSGWSNQLSPSGIVTELFSGWPHALRPTKTAQQGMIPRHQACLMCPAHYECSQSRLVNGVIGDYARRRRTDGFRHSYSSHAGLAKRGDVSGGDRTAGRSALTHDDQARLGFVAASLAGGGPLTSRCFNRHVLWSPADRALTRRPVPPSRPAGRGALKLNSLPPWLTLRPKQRQMTLTALGQSTFGGRVYFYSVRSAVTGSTAMARRAGSQQAANATAAMMMIAMA